jgi:hypothetical protein
MNSLTLFPILFAVVGGIVWLLMKLEPEVPATIEVEDEEEFS